MIEMSYWLAIMFAGGVLLLGVAIGVVVDELVAKRDYARKMAKERTAWQLKLSQVQTAYFNLGVSAALTKLGDKNAGDR